MMFQTIKLTFFKIYCNLLISSESDGDPMHRLESLGRVLMYISPIAFIIGVLDLWYQDNEAFTLSAVGFIFANAIIGLIAHFVRKDFNWETFLTKTMKMVLIISGVYFVLELIISPIGDNSITDGFRSTIQVSTLLWPGGKILKNFFIWSGGEHPPKWVMQKLYNFQKNGDLNAFLNKSDKDEHMHYENDTDDESPRYNKHNRR
jgi:hypothetical protein